MDRQQRQIETREVINLKLIRCFWSASCVLASRDTANRQVCVVKRLCIG